MPSFMGRIEGGRIVLNVVVGPPGMVDPTEDFGGFKALLDTGATKSGISVRLIEQLGLKNNGEWVDMVGVHGPASVPLYNVSLAIPISENPNQTHFKGDHSLEVAELALDTDKAGFDVLLGMDFLASFHLTIYGQIFILSS